MGDGWRRLVAALLALVLFAAHGADAREPVPGAVPGIAAAELPAEARQTIELIKKGGPLPYERDGAVFGNFERLLPSNERGYYREYTVKTPGVKSRGARRIIAGRAGELYYTDDHYKSFRRVRENR
jgi:ribonuclease T1